ncbi:hypothetical protein EON67_05955 [archaeon]|nr:MAG: hypothetical protein EON67_05955 [archaeon]
MCVWCCAFFIICISILDHFKLKCEQYLSPRGRRAATQVLHTCVRPAAPNTCAPPPPPTCPRTWKTSSRVRRRATKLRPHPAALTYVAKE